MDASPHAIGKMKKKRKKVRTPDDALTAKPPPTAPAAKKSKTTKKKKTAEPVDLLAMPMWVLTINTKKHHVVAIAHEQKMVASNVATITGDVANEPTLNYQWSHKGPFGKRIVPGNPEYGNMLPLQAFLHMMPPAQLALLLELTNVRLATKDKRKMTCQELLQWIGACVLNASINFWGDRHKLWEGGGATLKYLPSFNLRATGISRNHVDDIWYAIRWSCQPPEQPHGTLSEWHHWMLVNNHVTNINKYRAKTFVPGDHLEADKTVI